MISGGALRRLRGSFWRQMCDPVTQTLPSEERKGCAPSSSRSPLPASTTATTYRTPNWALVRSGSRWRQPRSAEQTANSYTTAAQAFGLRLPVTLGHEVAGTVVESGAAVTRIRPGDRVALESHIACGDCYHCRVGQGHNCLRMQLLGLHVDGGFAERTVVAEQACYKLPESVSLEVVLSLSLPARQCIPYCAASTRWQANR